MRGRFARVSDRAIGIVLGVALGVAVILLFLFLGSRDAIDEPSISGGTTQTVTQPATITAQPAPKPPK
jgi:ABC-type Mn2+/Zn2+ transport system permease subunit